MFVAVARIAFAIPDAETPKSRRHVIGKVIERVRSKFNASVADVGDPCAWQKAVIGISVVGNEQNFVRGNMDRILTAIDELYVAPVVYRSVEVIPMGDSVMGGDDWSRMAAKMGDSLDSRSAACSTETTGDGMEDRDGAYEACRHRKQGKCRKARDDGQEAPWPGVKTLADVEDPNDPEAAGFRAPSKDRQQGKKGGGKVKSAKDMNDEERAAAIRALVDMMRHPKG